MAEGTSAGQCGGHVDWCSPCRARPGDSRLHSPRLPIQHGDILIRPNLRGFVWKMLRLLTSILPTKLWAERESCKANGKALLQARPGSHCHFQPAGGYRLQTNNVLIWQSFTHRSNPYSHHLASGLILFGQLTPAPGSFPLSPENTLAFHGF